MRGLLIAMTFLLTFISAVAWQIPLAFAFNTANLQTYGLRWQGAQGTIWHGRIDGLALGIQEIGSAELRLIPGELLKGRVTYDVNWHGPPGRGTGRIGLGKTHMSLENVRAELDIAMIRGLSDQVRNIGGIAYFRADQITFQDTMCQMATGSFSTDVLSRVGTKNAQDWPELAGDLSCDEGMLLVPLEAKTDKGEAVVIVARIGLSAPSSLDAKVTGADIELEAALAMLGFWLENGEFIYRREVSILGSLP